MSPACRSSRRRRLVLGLGTLLALFSGFACGGGARPVTAPTAAAKIGDHETGYASWYGPDYHGRQTASGERYNMFELTAAHRTLPFGTLVKVDNLENNLSVVVKINDRGPFVRGRIIDLSYRAAREIQCSRSGMVKVRIEVVGLPDGSRASKGVDAQDLIEDAIGVVPLAEEVPLGVVDHHVGQGRDAVLPHDLRLPVHDVDLPDRDVVPF